MNKTETSARFVQSSPVQTFDQATLTPEQSRVQVLPEKSLHSVVGAPGTGKTTIARELAHQTGAVYLRIDVIEQAIRDADVLAGDVAASEMKNGAFHREPKARCPVDRRHGYGF